MQTKSTPEPQNPSSERGSERARERTSAGFISIPTKDTEEERITQHRADIRLRNMKQTVITTARLIQERLHPLGYRAIFLTLTYAEHDGWRANHLKDFNKRVREYLKRKDLDYHFVWSLELTKKGRPHYHVVIWLPKSMSLPKPDKRGWWPHGMTRIERLRKTVAYIAKYASKGDSNITQYPKGARMHGNGGLNKNERAERTWWKAPKWVRELTTIESHITRVSGGWLSKTTGEFFESPFKFLGFNGPLIFLARRA